MNDLDLIKQFILRKQDLLVIIKPICLIMLLDESKAEILSSKNDYNSFRFSENNLIPQGEDIYQQNAIDLAKEFYKLRVEETENIIDSLNSIVDNLKGKLHLNIDYPIYIEKLAYERRSEIEWIFDLIATKSKNFQSKCFEILKSLIFGELIRINYPIIVEEKKRFNIANKHFRDLKIAIGQSNKPQYDNEVLEVVNQVKKDLVNLGYDSSKTYEVFDDEVMSLEKLLSWYGIKDNGSERLKELENKISQNINSLEINVNKIIAENKLYLSLISDFKANFEEWKQSWVNEELPSEELF